MAETHRMTADQVVSYLMEGEGLDVLRESLSWMVQQLMEAEVSELVGAGLGERAPEERLTHRNGYRSRAWATRAGEIRCGRLHWPRRGRGGREAARGVGADAASLAAAVRRSEGR